MTRTIVILVVIMAIGKIAYHEYMYRASTDELIIALFGQSAAKACRADSKKERLQTPARAWSKPVSIKLVIGKPNLKVYFWRIHDAKWKARWKNPYLFIVAEEEPAYVVCEYDIVHDRASVHRVKL